MISISKGYENDDEICQICFEDNSLGKLGFCCKKNHKICKNCFNNWKKKNKKCPLCRTNLNDKWIIPEKKEVNNLEKKIIF